MVLSKPPAAMFFPIGCAAEVCAVNLGLLEARALDPGSLEFAIAKPRAGEIEAVQIATREIDA